MKKELQAIQELSKDTTLLYVEDNAGLRSNMEKFLTKICKKVIIAEDGIQGYEKFLEYKPKIIITDIRMPNMHGFKMIQKIRAIEPLSKIIILSAYDEKQHLQMAINFHVFRYLNKPVKTTELLRAIFSALKTIEEEENRQLFYQEMNTIFNYQNNIVVMMHAKKFLICNQRFLEFFNVNNLEEYEDKYGDIDSLLLEHKGFLSSTPTEHWYDVIAKNPGKLFHAKITNHEGAYRHLILKARSIPDKAEHYVLSMDDITELNLMSLFDTDTAKEDSSNQHRQTIISLLKVIQNNSSEIKIHNFYKGLTIVNPAVISKVSNDEVILKTVHPQLKVIHLSKYMVLTSEIFSNDVACHSIKAVDFDNQSITVGDMRFSSYSVTNRKYIRLEPDEKHTCSLFYKDVKFLGETKIIDISEVSVKIGINALPAGMSVDTNVKISFTLNLNGRLLSITTDSKVYRIDEDSKHYFVVLLYELNKKHLQDLKEYLASRQMALIREFKSMDIM